jgi:UDP-3-O-[3-hydroxymyristoyl] glucosamine N-acyltransferase
MASTATTRGKYRKQGLGDGLNTWGLSSGLNGLFDVMDEAIHGVNEITLTGTAYTLSSTNYTSNDIRYRILKFSGNFAATITIPATQNWFLIENNTGQTLTFSNGSNSATLATPLAGLLTTNGTTVTMLPLPDGTNVAIVANAIGSVNTVAGDIANVNTLAGQTAEIGRLGTTANVAAQALLGTTANVANQALLGTSANVTAQGLIGTTANIASQALIGTSANIAIQALLGTSANITAQALIGTSANIAAQALLGTSANVTAQGLIGTSANIAAQALIGTTANINAQALIGTSANIAIQALLGTSANVAAMALLGTTQNVANQALLGTTQNVSNMNTLAPISADITTTAGVSTSVNAYAKQYSFGSGDISTRGDGTGTVAEGDIRFRTDTDTMRVYTGSTWQDIAVTAGSFLQVTNNLSDLNNAATARTNLGGVITEISQDTSPQLGGDLDMQSHSISSGVLGIKNTGSQSELRLYCETGNAHFTSIKSAPHAQYSGNLTLQLPATVGAAGQVLTDVAGNGVLAWSTPSAGGSVATQMKFS